METQGFRPYRSKAAMERSTLILLLLLTVYWNLGAAYDSWQDLDDLLVKRAEGDSCVHEGTTYPDGATFMIECNTCRCTNGIPACTQMACQEPTTPAPICTCTRRDRSFTCGQKIMANPATTCTCLHNNQIGCQIMPNPVPDRCFFNRKFYQRGERFRKGRCNRCGCLGGNLVTCSMIDCSDPPKRVPGCTYKGKTYKKGERFLDACNRCDCVSNYVACTQLICVPPDAPPQPAQRELPWEWVGPN